MEMNDEKKLYQDCLNRLLIYLKNIRIVNLLRKNEINLISEVENKTDCELLNIKGMGKGSVVLLRQAIVSYKKYHPYNAYNLPYIIARDPSCSDLTGTEGEKFEVGQIWINSAEERFFVLSFVKKVIGGRGVEAIWKDIPSL